MAAATSFTVSSASQLNAAIAQIDLGGTASALDTAYTITVTADLTLTRDIAAIALAAGDTLTITGAVGAGGRAARIIGNNAHRGFVVGAGAVTFANLGLQGMVARGGNGAAGRPAGGGGGAFGAGLFVGAGTAVTLAGVQFSGNRAIAGRGGATGAGTGAGGAGMADGFGAGGAGGQVAGFGGGGGGGAAGGFGGGSNAGGGLAAGGDIFVQQGGMLAIAGGTLGAGTLAGGAGGGTGTAGGAFGSALFAQGDSTITLGNVTVTGGLADQSGSGGSGASAGTLHLAIMGAATLAAASSFSGGIGILAGGLTLAAPGAAGSGTIAFAAPGLTLTIGNGDAPANLIAGFAVGETIDLLGIGTATGATLDGGNLLAITGGSADVTLALDPAQDLGGVGAVLSPDGTGGTAITLVTTRFLVATEAELDAALVRIDRGGADAAPGQHYTIVLTAGITLGADLEAVNLAAGASLTFAGNGNTLDGAGLHRGLFVYAGTVAIDDLVIADAVAAGGTGGTGALPGGGGGGLGGGLFVGAAGTVTLRNVTFAGDAAIGGDAGAAGIGYGGGGGLGGAGGAGGGRAGGGGGIGGAATGGSLAGSLAGGAGIVPGAAGGRGGTGNRPVGGTGGADGGGGGAAGTTVTVGSGRGGGNSHTYPGHGGSGGIGGAYGGGGAFGAAAGFGGGGGAGAGGWGGGGSGAAGGFGGGDGSGGAGGGLGAGGDVFVAQGGSLAIVGAGLGAGTVAGGQGSLGGAAGSAWGSAIFLQGGSPLSLAAPAGQTIDIAGAIADSAAQGGAGAAGLLLAGAGTVRLDSASSFTGGIVVTDGTLSLGAAGAAGRGAITFAYGATATLIADAVPGETISGFLPGITIDLRGIGTATAAPLGPDDRLHLAGGAIDATLTLDPAQLYDGEEFVTAPDGSGGTLITATTIGNDHPPFLSGPAAIAGDDHTAFAPLAGMQLADLDAGQVETATVTLSNPANGALSNLGPGSYDPATAIYTVSGTAAEITSALLGLTFTPTEFQVPPGLSVATGFAIHVTDGTMAAATTRMATVTALNDAPVVAGGSTGLLDAYWNVAFPAFAGAVIADPDAGARETVTITLADSAYPGSPTDGNGTLALAIPGMTLTQTAPGTYQLSAGSPADVTAALRAMTFTAVPHPAQPGFTLTYLTLSVSDGIAPAATSGWTEVAAGLPIFTGTRPDQAATDGTVMRPFTGVAVSDSDGLSIQGLTISVVDPASYAPTNAHGLLAGPGLTRTGIGTYTLAITPGESFAAIDTALQAIRFRPSQSAAPVTTRFVLTAFDGATTASNDTTTVIASPPALAASQPPWAQPLLAAGQAMLPGPFAAEFLPPASPWG